MTPTVEWINSCNRIPYSLINVQTTATHSNMDQPHRTDVELKNQVRTHIENI